MSSLPRREGSRGLTFITRTLDNIFTMIPPRHFHTMSFFRHPGLVRRDFFEPMDSLGSIMVNIQGMKPNIWLELNTNILVRDVEGMYIVQCTYPGTAINNVWGTA